MTKGTRIVLAVNALALLTAGAWFYFHQAWDSGIALLTLLAVFVGEVVKVIRERRLEMGKGGAAIRVGKAGKLAVNNQGEISGGKGGSGGDGGDAIHVADGLEVTIINNGVIAGGDAGRGSPAFVEKVVNFRYPDESGLQRQIESEGFSVAWCNESRLEGKLLDGWHRVEVLGENGIRVRFRLKTVFEDQILIKRKN